MPVRERQEVEEVPRRSRAAGGPRRRYEVREEAMSLVPTSSPPALLLAACGSGPTTADHPGRRPRLAAAEWPPRRRPADAAPRDRRRPSRARGARSCAGHRARAGGLLHALHDDPGATSSSRCTAAGRPTAPTASTTSRSIGFFDDTRFFRVDRGLHGAVRHPRRSGGRRQVGGREHPRRSRHASRTCGAS